MDLADGGGRALGGEARDPRLHVGVGDVDEPFRRPARQDVLAKDAGVALARGGLLVSLTVELAHGPLLEGDLPSVGVDV